MDEMIIVFGSMGIGTLFELVKKLTKLPEKWYKVVAVLISWIYAIWGTFQLGAWDWKTYIIGGLIISFGQLGWDFMIAKPIVKKILGIK